MLEQGGAIPYRPFMSSVIERLAQQAMKLPGEARAELADLLIESLDGEGLGPIDELWLTEAKRRRDEVRSGLVETVPGDRALRKVRDSLA